MQVTGQCKGCGQGINISVAELDDQGDPVCGSCARRAELASGHARSRAQLHGAASTAALLGLGSFCVGLYTAVPAIFVGSGALVAARTANRLAPGSVPTWVYLAAGFGVAIGALRVLGFVGILALSLS